MDSSYLIIIAVLLGCLASTIPVFIALFFTGMIGLVYMVGIDPLIVIEVLYRSMDKFALIVVLFFVLCGNIMTTGSIVEKLIKAKERSGCNGDRGYFHWIAGIENISVPLEIHKRIRLVAREEAAKLG